MANKITYADKVAILPQTVHENQFWAEDANELKNKHNLNDDRITGVENGQTGGFKSFTTLALLQAYATPDINDGYKVTNDSTSSNNGYYHYVSGTTYVKDDNLANGLVESGNTDPASGGTTYTAIQTQTGVNITDLEILNETQYTRVDPDTISTPASGKVFVGVWRHNGSDDVIWTKTSTGQIRWGIADNSARLTDLSILNEVEYTRVDPDTIGNPVSGEVFVGVWRKNTFDDVIWTKTSTGQIRWGIADNSARLTDLEILNQVNQTIIDPDTIGNPDGGTVFIGVWRPDGVTYKQWIKEFNGDIKYLSLDGEAGLINDDIDFCIIADTHVNSVTFTDASKLIEDSISALKRQANIFCLHLGDVTDLVNSLPEKQEAERLFSKLNLPMYITLGNHDVALDSQSSIDDFYTTISDGYYSNPFSYNHTTKLGYYHVNVKGLDIIILNQMFSSADIDADYEIDATQETWLEDTLDSLTGSSRRLIVCSHVTLTPNLGDTAIFRHETVQAARIRGYIEDWQTLNGIVLGCFNGHRHSNRQEVINTINYVGFNAQTRVTPYTGDDDQIAFSFLTWSELNLKLTITGGTSRQTSYEFTY